MVSFEGYGENYATFIAGANVAQGAPVNVTASGTVSAAASGAAFCGIAKDVRGGCAAVQLAGYVRMKYTGTAPAFGLTGLVSGGADSIRTGTSDKKALVVDVDTASSTCGFIL